VIRDSNFPNNPPQAIINGFASAESHFLQYAKTINPNKTTIEKSGSCALVVLIVGNNAIVLMVIMAKICNLFFFPKMTCAT